VQVTKVTCDHCQRDITDYAAAQSQYRLCVTAEHMPTGFTIWEKPPCRTHHFCGMKCLSEWAVVRTMAPTEEEVRILSVKYPAPDSFWEDEKEAAK
jgi:hypothetical protein